MIPIDRLQEMYDAVHKKKSTKFGQEKNIMEDAMERGTLDMSPKLEVMENSKSYSDKFGPLKYLFLLLPIPIYGRIRRARKMHMKR